MQNSSFIRHLSPIQPTLTSHLFPRLSTRLLELLSGLSPQEWSAPAVKQWNVKDVVAHLLDSSMRRLSIGRDGYWGEPFDGSTPEEFKAFLHKLNRDWVVGMKRVSPQVLCELLEYSERELATFFDALHPHAPALFAVSWAAEEQSENWFDIAREYTERWHHQQQIRDAVGKPGIMTDELYTPVLETFVRALPVAYRSLRAENGTTVVFEVTGHIAEQWTLVHQSGVWKLMKGAAENPNCKVSVAAESAWKLFTNGLTSEETEQELKVTGDARLAEPCFTVRAIAT